MHSQRAGCKQSEVCFIILQKRVIFDAKYEEVVKRNNKMPEAAASGG